MVNAGSCGLKPRYLHQPLTPSSHKNSKLKENNKNPMGKKSSVYINFYVKKSYLCVNRYYGPIRRWRTDWQTCKHFKNLKIEYRNTFHMPIWYKFTSFGICLCSNFMAKYMYCQMLPKNGGTLSQSGSIL